MAKTINSFNIDLSDMAAAGGSRSFSIEGDADAIFSLEVKNEDGYYYNFNTEVFSATKARLKQKAIASNGSYSNSITFPSITDNDQYDFYLFAESAYDTVHADYKEVRFGDDSLDINSSKGSNSNLLQKVIYQYTDTTITIDPRFTALSGTTPTWFSSRTTDTVTVGRGRNSGKQSFSCTVLAPVAKAIQILRQPTESDFIKELDVRWELSHASNQGASTGGGPVLIQGENPWIEAASLESSAGSVGGATRGRTACNGGVEAGTRIIVDALPSNTQVGDRLTGFLDGTTGEQNSCSGGASAPDTQIVLVTAINPTGSNANQFDVDTSVTIANDLPLNFEAPYYYRYKTKASLGGYGVLGLKTGSKEGDQMKDQNPDTVASDGGNRPNTLGPYEDSTTHTLELMNDNGSITEQTVKTINISYPAIDTTGFKPTITNGKVTKQDGVLTFTSPQKIDTAVPNLEGNTWFKVSGMGWIKAIHNTEIKFTNLKAELTAPTTTTTSGVSNSTTIPVADREGVINGISTISGIGINSSAADPTIASGGEADGAGSWTASAAQTLENGITLTVGGTSRNVTITGDIEIVDCGDSDFTIILDVRNFLTGT